MVYRDPILGKVAPASDAMLDEARPPGELFAEGHVTADSFEIRYLEAGEGEPVVWLHGAGGLSLSYVHDRLARDRRVIAVEMPGWGQAANTRSASASQMATTMGAALAELGLDSCHLWGTSVGSTVALHLVLAQPDVAKTLVLESPSAFRRGAVDLADLVAQGPQAIAALFNRHPERVSWRAPQPLDDDRMDLIARIRGPEHDEELEARLTEITVPTLILYGTCDGAVPADGPRLLRKRLRRSALAFVYDAAHDLQGDRPGAVGDAIGDFLERGMGFGVQDVDPRINP